MVTEEKRKEYREKVEGISADLKDKTIFRAKFGLDDGLFKSNAETGRIFGMTGEAVRQAVARISKEIGSPEE